MQIWTGYLSKGKKLCDLFQKYLIRAGPDWTVSKVKGHHAMVSDVTKDDHVLKETEEGVDVRLAVLVVPPVEVQGKHGRPKRCLD